MEPNYDYRNDPEVFTAACMYDRFNDIRAYDKLIDSHLEIPFPFYDLEVLGMRDYPKGNDFETNIQCYYTVLSLLFRDHYIFKYKYDYKNRAGDYYSDTKDFDDVIMGTHRNLIQSFQRRLEEHYGKEFEIIVGWLEKWIEVTYDLITNCFESRPDSNDIHGNPRDNIGAYELTLRYVQQLYRESVCNLPYGQFQKASKIVLYNFWGDSFEEDIKTIRIDVAHTEEESQKIDSFYNGLRFDEEYSLLVNQALALSVDIEPQKGYLSQTRRSLQFLFSDYTKRLNLRGIHNRETLSFASHYWQYITSLSIRRIIEVELQKYRLKGYRPGDILHWHEFRLDPEHRRRYDALKELSSISLSSLDLIDFYIRDIKEGILKFPWADALASFEIDYHELFERMKSDKLIAGITYGQFKYAIESGELSALQENPNRSGAGDNTPALKKLIQWVLAKKDRLSKADKQLLVDWGEAAAHSIINRDGNPFDLETITKATYPGATYKKMDKILADIMRL